MKKYKLLGILASFIPVILLANDKDNAVPEIISKSNVVKCEYNEKMLILWSILRMQY